MGLYQFIKESVQEIYWNRKTVRDVKPLKKSEKMFWGSFCLFPAGSILHDIGNYIGSDAIQGAGAIAAFLAFPGMGLAFGQANKEDLEEDLEQRLDDLEEDTPKIIVNT